MKKFKIACSFFFIIVFFGLLVSSPVDEEQVAKIAVNLAIERGGMDRSNIIISNITNRGEDIVYYYVVEYGPVGFGIISADDRVVPILGYSFEGMIDTDNLPIQLIDIFESWQQGIQYVIDNNISSTPEIDLEWQKYLSADIEPDQTRDVSPLITANWNQGGSWNNMCPGNALVGCVAVSMAQVMYYWQYPETGVGSNTYYDSDYGNLSVNFSNAFYNYENMQDNNATESSQLLLYHAGVSVDMDYGEGASGAYVVWGQNSALNAMETNFSYHEDISATYKSNHSDESWDNLIKNQMDQGKPVIYRAYAEGNGAGHAWNVDGYQGENHFHCNWGWGGGSNGYFYLNNLNAGGYNFIVDQAAIIDIFPVSYGCTDEFALNYNPDAEYEDGSCIWEILPPSDIISLSSGNSISTFFDFDVVVYPEILTDDGYGNIDFAIKMINPIEEVSGFQFQMNSVSDILGENQYSIVNIYGGEAESNNFTVQESNGIILGFSFTGSTIPQGEHNLINISAEYNPELEHSADAMILASSDMNPVFSGANASSLQSIVLPTRVGFGWGYSSLVLESVCGDNLCDQFEYGSCNIDCYNINPSMQYAVSQNDNFQEFIPTINHYMIDELEFNTEYCYQFQSYYDGLYSDESETFCNTTSLPPQINTDLNDINIYLEPGSTGDIELSISNTGSSILEYSIDYSGDAEISSNFTGQYYITNGTGNAPSFGDLVLTREDEVIDFSWGNGSPDPSIQNNDFQVRWTGKIITEYSGQHDFRSYTDDGVRLYINGSTVIDHWSDQGSTSRYGSIELNPGRHDLIMEYYENGGGAVSSLFWTMPGQSETLVYPTDSGWLELSNTNGNIFPGQSNLLNITVQTENLDIGVHFVDLIISSNDPFASEINIPIHLTIGISDCNGEINGGASIDECGVCTGGNTGITPNSDQDCFGNCFGQGNLDNSGVCCEIEALDECGQCYGENGCFGCTDPDAENYSPESNIDDGSCQFLGDCNQDGAINVVDVVLIVNGILELIELNDNQLYLSDINSDNEVNITDIVIIVNLILAN